MLPLCIRGVPPSHLDREVLHLHEVPRVVKFRETVNRMVVARGWGRGVERYYLMGPEFQFYKMKKMDHGNGHTTI